MLIALASVALKSAVELIASKNTAPQTNEIVEVQGYTTPGDGGDAQWRFNGNTGLTASQSPAQLGNALINDASGNQWAFVGKLLNIVSIGGVIDNSTDNTNVTAAAQTWSNGTGGKVFIPRGNYVTGPIQVDSESLILDGAGISETTIKLLAGSDTHLVNTSGTAELTLTNLTLDQNSNGRADQAGGHSLRNGGSSLYHIENVRCTNAYGYGAGIGQAGTVGGAYFKNVHIDNTGNDGIDIKDKNLDNETIIIEGLHVEQYGLSGAGEVGLDIRGPILASNINIEAIGDNSGLRFRQDSANGRAGQGSVNGVYVTAENGTDLTLGIEVAADLKNWNINNVSVDGCNLAFNVTSLAVGGNISNLTAKNIWGGDCARIASNGTNLDNIELENTSASSRIIDYETTAQNNTLSNFNFTDNSSGAGGLRIQASAANNKLSNGRVSNNVIGDAGTNTEFNNVTAATAKSFTASVADGGTISHGLAAAPKYVNVTGSIASNTVTVTAIGSSNFTVAIKDDTGAAGTTQTIYWEASL